MSDSNAILQAIQVLKAQGVLPNLDKAQNQTLSSLMSEAWMSDAILALIGYHPTRVYLDSQPLWLDNSPVLS